MTDSAIVPEGQTVTLAGKEYTVKPVRFTKVYRFKRLVFEIIKQLDKIDVGVLIQAFIETDTTGKQLSAEERAARDARTEKAIAALDKLTDVLLANIGTLFTIAMPKVDAKIFDENTSDEDAPDILEMWDAFNVILKVNRLHFLLNNRLTNLTAQRSPATETPTTTQLVQSLIYTDSIPTE